jgi:hypothetical protein
MPQASKDLNAFLRARPTAMTYDLSAKCYVATEKRLSMTAFVTAADVLREQRANRAKR